MTPPIRIQLLAGPQAGLQTAHTEPRLPFGRDPHCAIAIDESHLSRQHGELLCEDGRWSVVNRSPNGTTVNGRRVKGDKPRELKPGDVIGVGGIKLFAVQFQPVHGGAGAMGAMSDVGAGDEPPRFDDPLMPGAPVDDAGARMRRRGKLWTFIGVYMALMLVVFVVLMLSGGEGGNGSSGPPAMLSPEQIAADVTRPIEKPRDEREAERHLAEAREWYGRSGSRIDGVFQAYHNYKLALAYAKKRNFDDGFDQRQYRDAEQKLVRELSDRYRDAYSQIATQQWGRARESLYDLLQMYRDTESPVYRNISEHLAYARSRGN